MSTLLGMTAAWLLVGRAYSLEELSSAGSLEARQVTVSFCLGAFTKTGVDL